MLVSSPSSSALGGNDALIGAGEVMHHRAGLVVVQNGADRHFQNHILALFAAAVGALAVPSALRLMFGIEAEVNQRVMPLARFHDHVTAASAIATGGTAAGNKLLPPEGHAAIAAVPSLHSNSCFIDEHSAFISVASLIPPLPPTHAGWTAGCHSRAHWEQDGCATFASAYVGQKKTGEAPTKVYFDSE